MEGLDLGPVELLDLSAAIESLAPPWRALARILERVSVNLNYAAVPLLRGRLGHRSVILYQSLGFFLIPMLRRAGYRVIAVCDAPPRPGRGVRGLRERLMPRLLRQATQVVRVFDFPWAGAGSSVAPNIIPCFPVAPRPYGAEPIRSLLFVGRLQPEKGLIAFLDIAQAMPDLEFVVFGVGALEAVVRERAAAHGNIHYRGYSTAWWDECGAGACLVGACPTEASWTAAREALLHGVPALTIPSPTGGPQSYKAYSDKIEVVDALTPATVRAALARLEEALRADPSAEDRLWQECRPERIAQVFASLI